MNNVFDYVKDLSFEKKYLFSDETSKIYDKFLVNRSFSYFTDTLLYANSMNSCSLLDSQMQHDFYFHGIPRRKRFSKWNKFEANPETQLIKEYYNLSSREAKFSMGILSEEKLDYIKKYTFKGGVK